MRRARVAASALGLLLLWAPSAVGKYRGTDVMDNIGPGAAFDGMADKYPLSAYALDYHVDGPSAGLGGVSAGDIPQLIAQFLASMIWTIISFALRLIIDVFAWAFSLDLIGGAHGALGPIANAVRGIYENLGGETWLVVAVIAAGIWALWRGLVQQRYTETFDGLAVSMVILIVGLTIIYQPRETIGQASGWTNDLSSAFLAAGSGRSPDDPTEAKRDVVAHLRNTLIYKPWVVLDFGGLKHCVNDNDRDGDGFPRPVPPNDPNHPGTPNPDATRCRDHVKSSADGHGGYAPRFLRYASGSDERNAEYEALKDGKAPLGDPQFAGYPVDRADAPAVDIQQAGGAYQRLGLVIFIAVGAVGIIALLMMLSAVVILAQIAALALLAFAPVVFVVGIFPGKGHDLFKSWGMTLLTALFIKVLYSLILGVLVLISAALTAAVASLGFLFAFGLQAAFFWLVLLYRKRITQSLLGATLRRSERYDEHRPLTRRAEAAAARPVSALVGMGPAAVGAAAGAVAGLRKQEPVQDFHDDDTERIGTPVSDDYRYDMATQSTHGSREWQEGEPHQLDGRDPRLRAGQVSVWPDLETGEDGIIEGTRRPESPPSGLVTGALDEPDQQRNEPVIKSPSDHDEKMAELGDLLGNQLEPPATDWRKGDS